MGEFQEPSQADVEGLLEGSRDQEDYLATAEEYEGMAEEAEKFSQEL